LIIKYSITTSRPINNIYDYVDSEEQYNQKTQETNSTRTSALTQINQALQSAHIDLTELGVEYFCLRGECLCNGDLPPQEEVKYHITHINKCL
jgi:hypothetical protein